MPTVYAIGETIYDIIFRNDQPVAARPGGSMLNSAVSLGRCSAQVELITELGDDHVGNLVLDFLHSNGVSTSYMNPVAGFKTPVSLAFLDDQNNAQYSFFKKYPEKRLEINWPMPQKGDFVLFGSFYSLDPTVHDKIHSFVKRAKEAGAIIVYDPNIRKNHLGEIQKLMHFVEENISVATVIRASDEDFVNLFGFHTGNEAYKLVQQMGCNYLVLTKGKSGADIYFPGGVQPVAALPVEVVSTIGAGDSFNAGLITRLISLGLTVDNLLHITGPGWEKLLDYAVIFAGVVCGSLDNYISRDTGENYHVR